MKDKNPTFLWLNRLASPLIDLLALLGFSALLPRLTSLFREQGWWAPVVVFSGYFLMCLGIYIGKRLEPWPADRGKPEPGSGKPGCVAALSWPYAAFVVVMGLESGGAFERNSVLWHQLENLTGGSQWILAPLILLFLAVLILFPLLLIMKPRPVIKYNRPLHWLLRLFAVTAVDLMALITAAYWQWQLSNSEPMEVALAGKILIFILGYAVFLMLYAPPRLALISLEPSRWSFAGYAILLGYILWGFLG
jgi:hypothetical protein